MNGEQFAAPMETGMLKHATTEELKLAKAALQVNFTCGRASPGIPEHRLIDHLCNGYQWPSFSENRRPNSPQM
jgi:hypothetical protein